ncbi:MAG: ABC transporter permease [Christensenellaceae bacterium]
MKQIFAMVRRNVKLYFRDKGLFFVSLITPLILLVLYSTFLAKVYRESFAASIPAGVSITQELLNAVVGGQLVSSLLAVSCVTVAFCSNTLMVQDKVNGARGDLLLSPIRRSAVAISYFAACVLSTLIVNLVAMGLCFAYLAATGWYLSLADALLLTGDVVLLTLFGVALSSCVHFFLNSQSQVSAVGTIVSAGYGLLCGAYMPIASFSAGLQHILMFLPGTYGTSLLRNHALAGAFREMQRIGFPADILSQIRDSIDCNLYFFDKPVSQGGMYAVLGGAILLCVGVYILCNDLHKKEN